MSPFEFEEFVRTKLRLSHWDVMQADLKDIMLTTGSGGSWIGEQLLGAFNATLYFYFPQGHFYT